MWSTAGIIFIFILSALLMFLRVLPALLALPIMAFLIALAGGIPLNDIFIYVIGDGAFRLHQAYTITLFGGMLSIFLQRSGIAENFVRKGAELAGDNPFNVSLIVLILTALLFTTLGGLGAIIMVATIILPIMSSVGISPLTIAGVFLIGLSVGGILNPQNWILYINVLKVDFSTVKTFALILFAISLIVGIVFIAVELRREKLLKISPSTFLKYLLALLIFITAVVSLTFVNFESGIFKVLLSYLKSLLLTLFVIFLIYILIEFVKKLVSPSRAGRLKWYAFLTPIVPLIIIFAFGSQYFIVAFIAGLLYGFITSYRKGGLNLLMQAIIDGGSSVIPAVALMLGIGMLLNAILGPANWNGEWKVYAQLRPLFNAIVPTSPVLYVVLFSILSPFALYRGPLNVWGLGYGIATLISAPVGTLPPASVMGLLLSVGQIQGVCDPTNTYNVWIANELRIDVNQILRKTFPYIWVLATLGLVVSAVMFL
mgnify:CR=1 FL=1